MILISIIASLTLAQADQYLLLKPDAPEVKAHNLSSAGNIRFAKKVASSKWCEIYHFKPFTAANKIQFHDPVEDPKWKEEYSELARIWEPSHATLVTILKDKVAAIKRDNLLVKLESTYSESGAAGALDFAAVSSGSDFIFFRGKMFNKFDFGNLMWGAAMKRLHYSLTTVKASSQCNAVLNTYSQNQLLVKPWHGLCLAGDSRADQLAIRAGYRDVDLTKE